MKKSLTLITACLFAIFLSACSPKETANTGLAQTNAAGASNDSASTGTSTKAPPADVVRVESPAVEISAGGSAEASVKLTIASGYHINANPPSFSYLKATELQLEPSGGITPGSPVYPSSVTRKFAFSKDPLAVYEGEATIKQPLKASGDARKGEQVLKAKLRIQACDEEACYPPRTIETQIPVKVK
ncbi:MAG TPA: protein-disulfide reductase DsbD domain-containing protein [Pyrinomonadaceae bacterium]|nr:protein-disulfide reductase DsbD domain-containing protein [Pyrinomonadaceae bacterium]